MKSAATKLRAGLVMELHPYLVLVKAGTLPLAGVVFGGLLRKLMTGHETCLGSGGSTSRWWKGNGDKYGNLNTGTDKSTTNEGARKGMDMGKSQVKATPTKKSGNQVNGSRFAVFNESMDEEANLGSSQVKGSTSKILTEISNRKPVIMSQLKPSAAKYLVDSLPIENSLSKNHKENGNEVWSKRKGKGTKKISQHSTSTQPKSMAAVEDSEVLQSLHNKMVEIRVAESQQCNDNEESNHSSSRISDTNPVKQQVEIVILTVFLFSSLASTQLSRLRFNKTFAASKTYRMAATEASSSSSVSGDDCVNPLDSSLSINGTAFSSSASSAINFISLCHRLKVLKCFWFCDFSCFCLVTEKMTERV
ncbi:hypothetical protein LWI29_010236 [Acer saccharum]|uniref:Uncharacterized protein n=1 Tax=Acer saccharum TaxID=4024 RepID=A0AA39SYW9_ACESA|nr:hypothetical protein LWI29_010236 [Acer saccharum]